MQTQYAPPAAHVQAFVEQLLTAGHTLITLVDRLAEALVESGTVGEGAAVAEIVAMMMGTVAVRLASVPEDDFTRATELIDRTLDGVFGDLQRAAQYAKMEA
jgi:hypothetical protein